MRNAVHIDPFPPRFALMRSRGEREFDNKLCLERDPIKRNRITLQIPLIVAQSFGEPLTLRRIAL